MKTEPSTPCHPSPMNRRIRPAASDIQAEEEFFGYCIVLQQQKRMHLDFIEEVCVECKFRSTCPSHRVSLTKAREV